LDTYSENNQGIGNHAWGGGLEANYFYFKYLGLSVDGNAFSESPGDNFGGTVTGNLILRLPLDDYLPNFHVAPYLFGGAGKFYSERVGLPTSTPGVKRYIGRSGVLADAGGGLEYRFNPNLGIFADARFNFTEDVRNEFITTRFGWGFGGEQEQLDADLLQLAEKVDISRLTLQAGRFAVVDVFDNNAFAHDPRGDFLNWAAVDALAFDYAADSLGFEEGLSLELNQKAWAARWGIFTIPRQPNVNATDGQYLRGWQQVAELEGRYTLCDHSGKVRLLGYLESAPMGSYKAAVVNFPPGMPDIAATRRYRYTYGLVLNIEQEITKDLGSFLRLAMRDPNYEVYQFSDVSRSLEIGLSLKGACWNRPNDTVGPAEMLGGLGHAQRRFFNDGGLGILIGDGKLPHYGPENVVEAYYNCELFKGINFTLDYQLAADPAYNKDRGPINIFSARLRIRF
jgi:hypothetical protein